MTTEKHPMTIQGYNDLKEELDHLKRVERLNIVKEIEVARGHGDLKENAEYHAAKEKQGMVEARIKYLNAKLAMSEVIDPKTLSGSRVMFGATVTIYDLDTDEEKTYQIVGDEEADIKLNRISYASPIAKALIGKQEGDEAVIHAPKGSRNVEISEVEYK